LGYRLTGARGLDYLADRSDDDVRAVDGNVVPALLGHDEFPVSRPWAPTDQQRQEPREQLSGRAHTCVDTSNTSVADPLHGDADQFV
jgi:hypothetical protein